MNSLKLEKRLRIIPLVCFSILIAVQYSFEKKGSLSELIVTMSLLIISVLAGATLFYLQKKEGRFESERHYLFYFFLVIAILIFGFSFLFQ